MTNLKLNGQEITAVFQTWNNGGLCTSALYTVSTDGIKCVNDFIESHYQSGTFATLCTFVSEKEAKEQYAKYWE